jgi:DNA-binding NarL/FixJ family response regulator
MIAEDSAILRDGLLQLLTDKGFAVTGAVSDGASLEVAVAADPPDVAVVDIRMPPTFTDEGLRVAIGLRRHHPGVGILLFSQYIETRYAAELLAGGAGHLQRPPPGARRPSLPRRMTLYAVHDGLRRSS